MFLDWNNRTSSCSFLAIAHLKIGNFEFGKQYAWQDAYYGHHINFEYYRSVSVTLINTSTQYARIRLQIDVQSSFSSLFFPFFFRASTVYDMVSIRFLCISNIPAMNHVNLLPIKKLKTFSTFKNLL